MAWTVEFAARAVNDIRAVLRWTEREFGSGQRQRYEAQIDRALRRLEAEGPEALGSRGLTVERPTLRRLALPGRAAHLLLYRQSGPGRILILRLLHAGQDRPLHLPD